uniref:Uncharacterized protein n=1 Tax=Anguilla anguilla TaxID=7936 RepID=A0A0E9VU73_ANGAN
MKKKNTFILHDFPLQSTHASENPSAKSIRVCENNHILKAINL